jgi:hypothetical protein
MVSLTQKILSVYGEVARRRRDGGGSPKSVKAFKFASPLHHCVVPLPVNGED